MFSKIPAAPMPPPMHMVTIPYRPLRRLSSRKIVAVSLAPVHPNGCPSATAPPLGLILLGIQPAFFDHRQRLRRESFIQLDHVNVFQL